MSSTMTMTMTMTMTIKRDAHAEGREAYHAGKSETENPFDLGEDEDNYLAWSDGWIEAAEEDEKEN